MYYLLALLSAILISLMIFVNGSLANLTGLYMSTVIIHAIGFIIISMYLITKKIKLKISRKINPIMYSGGIIGFLTLLFNTSACGKINLSAIVALCLFGQMITSLFIDNFGFFKMPKKAISKLNILGVVTTSIGIVYMLQSSNFVISAIILSFLSGVTIVISRTTNAELAEHTNIWTSTWFNFFFGLITATIVYIFVSINNFNLPSENIVKLNNLWIFTGGLLGVLVVSLSNVCVKKISSFNMTLIIFVGQIFTSVIIDFLITKQINTSNIIGGLFATSGLIINLFATKKEHIIYE